MEQQEELEIRIWEYIDGSIDESGKQHVSSMIAENELWRQKFEELSLLHNSLQVSIDAEHPSMRFSKNVMEAVAATHIAPATKKYINYNLVRGIAAFFIISLMIMIGYAIATTNPHATSSGYLSALQIKNPHISGYFKGGATNVIIGIYVVLGLVLADKMLHRSGKKNKEVVKG